MQVDEGGFQLMKNEDFSPELLRMYYDKLFPYLQMVRWLSYRNDPKSSSPKVEKDFFLRREFTFVLAGDIFCRYLCFRDADEFRAAVMSRQPIRMEIGAVFTHPPKNHTTIIKDAYRPLERELVFDIDMDDYDDIRTCCRGAKLCTKCWTFMKAAIKILKRALNEDFGFKHTLFVYSGRRGVHCWVCDPDARRLSNERRSAVAEYLTLVAGGQNKCRADLNMQGMEELHPSITEAHKICIPYFRDDPNGVLQGQDILRKGPHLSNILETMSIAEREAIAKYIESHPEATSRDIWQEFEKLHSERTQQAEAANGNERFKARREAKTMLKDIVIQYTCPRLDINVSKQMNHLLKAPFVVHPKTGRVCVPIDPDKADAFNPLEVPTIGRLIEELNQSGDPRQTSLKSYTHFFEAGFLQPLERETAQEMQMQGDMTF
jgi:DNA primase small subunit